MSALYLIRHGQAGSRRCYDTLSELGRRQARLLGKRIAESGPAFDAVYCGRLERQRLTARLTADACNGSKARFPEIFEEPLWDEFDLDAVYGELGPLLAERDVGFAKAYEQMTAELDNEKSLVHRRHHECDIAMVRAWVLGALPFSGETWQSFRARISSAVRTLSSELEGRRVAVFTSATPIAIVAAEALGLDEENLWRLAGVTYNSSVTILRPERSKLRLLSFNALPHLPEESLWSFR